MEKQVSDKNLIRRMLEGRAVRIFVGTATAFLCVLTALEFAALRFEWNIPALHAFSSGDGFWSEGYQREELALDDSTENEILEETDLGEAGGQPDAGKRGEPETGGQPMPQQKEESVEDGQPDANEPEAGESGQPETEAAGDSAEQRETVEDGEGEAFPYYIRINRAQNCITVYTMDAAGEYTVPYKAIICSTGLYNATPRGVYRISTKYRWRELYGHVYGQYATRIHGGILFHSVPYYRKAENTLCTDKYNKLGEQASMGCVRLTVEDAKWIAENCPEGTTVEIYEDTDPGPLGKPEAAKIDAESPNKGWDPTDPSEENPWRNPQTQETDGQWEMN